MKKRFVSALLAGVLTIGLLGTAACSKKASDDNQDLLAQIKERGTIIVAMEGNWAPWNYHDEDDKLVGFDTEVATHIAEKLGVEPEFVEGDWDGLLGGIEAGRYDIMVNGVDVTDEREEAYTFSEPYCYNKTVIIVPEDNDDIHSLDDLDGKTTANSLNSTYMEIAEQHGATVTGVDTLDQTLELVMQGRVDATLNAEVSFNDYMKVHSDAPLKIAATAGDATAVAIPMRKDPSTDSLKDAIDKAIEELRDEGVLSELSMKYFDLDLSSEE